MKKKPFRRFPRLTSDVLKQKLPVVAIAGRPNVGKSTLFNRLARRRAAITHNLPGVTRDLHEAIVTGQGLAPFRLVDTGGYNAAAHAPLPAVKLGAGATRAQRSYVEALTAEVVARARRATESADLILFVLDAATGLTAADEAVASEIRALGRPVAMVLNKLDRREARGQVNDFYRLGFGAPVCISAERGEGIEALLDRLAHALGLPHENELEIETAPPTDENSEEAREERSEAEIPRIAIVGRPNAGKSLLFNRLLNRDRMIVSPLAGTTRDSVDCYCRLGKQDFLFVDTAGLRRKSRLKQIGNRVEDLSTQVALGSISRADCVLFLIDAYEGITHQDAQIAALIAKKNKPCLVLANKWDLVPNSKDSKLERAYREAVQKQLGRLSHSPIHFISAETGYHLKQLPQLIRQLLAENSKRIPTGELNRFLSRLIQDVPSTGSRRPLKFYYITQAAVAPPLFMLSTNQPDALRKGTHRNFVENAIRREFGFKGSPVRLVVRGH